MRIAQSLRRVFLDHVDLSSLANTHAVQNVLLTRMPTPSRGWLGLRSEERGVQGAVPARAGF